MAKSHVIEAVYENGVLRPLQALTGLVEHSRVKLTIEYELQPVHPLEKFAGILSDQEAEEMQAILAQEFNQIDANGW